MRIRLGIQINAAGRYHAAKAQQDQQHGVVLPGIGAAAGVLAGARRVVGGDVGELDWTDMGVKAGRAVLRGGTYLGLSALANMDSIKTKPIRKHIPWMAMVLGLAGELGINDKSDAGRVLSGVSQGLFTFGMVDGAATWLGDNAKAKLGLSGLGASRSDDIPRDESGIDWFQLAEEAEQDARPGAASMQGLASDTGRDKIAFG